MARKDKKMMGFRKNDVESIKERRREKGMEKDEVKE